MAVATADIPADTVLFTIPRQSIICKDTSSLVAKLPEVFDPPQSPQDDNNNNNDGDEDHDMDGTEENNEDDDDDDDDDTAQDSWTTLILILIHEHLQGAASPWKPYLDVLPISASAAALHSTPMFWSADDLAELQASPVASKVGRDEAESMIRRKILPVITAHEDVFYPAGAPPAGGARLSEDDLVQLAFRMGSVIMAYAFDLEKDDDDDEKNQGGEEEEEEEDEWVEDREGKTMLGMVPMADILNADATFNAHMEHGEHALVATALRPIARGEEILNYYGPLSNGELLRRYGYVTQAHQRWNLVDLSWATVVAGLKHEVSRLSDQEWDTVLCSFRNDDDDVEGEGDLEDAFIIDRGAEDPDSEGRVHDDPTKRAALPEELVAQMKEVLKAVKKVRPDAVPDKTARDRAMYAAIARALETRTNEYRTGLEHDLQLYERLQASPPDNKSLVVVDRKRMALDVRIGEKMLLKEASQAAHARLALLAEAARDGDGRSAKRRKM